MLVLRPGILTRRYIEGARARFVSPMALFLFSVFLMFAVFQVLGIAPPSDLRVHPEVAGSMDETAQAGEEKLEDARANLRALPAGDPGRAAASERVIKAAQAVQGLQAIRPVVTGSGEVASATTGIDWIDKSLIKKWREQPELMLYKLQAQQLQVLLAADTPVAALRMAAVRMEARLQRLRPRDLRHILTQLHVAAAYRDLVALAAGVSGDVLGLAAVLIPPVHMYRQLRGAYSLRRFSALWRLIVLYAMILVIMVLFLQILLLLGAL